MIDLVGAGKDYTTKSRGTVSALHGIDLHFDSTGFVFVVGRSGSGKTTLLNLLGGVDIPSRGSVSVGGRDLSWFTSRQLDEHRNYRAGFVFQDYNLLPEYTVAQNIELAVRMQVRDPTEITARTTEALQDVGLPSVASRRVSELSGGQQQRVAIARALAKDYRVILCDEPTGNLDRKTAVDIMVLLAAVARTRLIVIVTHDETLATEFGNRIIRLDHGRVVEDRVVSRGPRRGVVVEPDTTVRRYLHFGASSLWQVATTRLLKGWLPGALVCLLLAVAFGLVAGFHAMSRFDPTVALAETLQTNGTSVFPVTRYVDKAYQIDDQYQYGPEVEADLATEADQQTLLDTIAGRATVSRSYFLNKPLQDFTPSKLPYRQLPDDAPRPFLADGFTEYVVVDDFAGFHQRLTAGRMPSAPTEVLIYDYMGYSLIQKGIGAVESIDELVGLTLTDATTGLSVTVAGVLASDYQSHLLTDGTAEYSRALQDAYLGSLMSLFVTPQFASNVPRAEWDTISIYDLSFLIAADRDDPEPRTVTDLPYRQLMLVDGTNHIDVIGDIDTTQDVGILLSSAQAAGIAGIPEAEVTPEFATSIRGLWNAEVTSPYYSKSLGSPTAMLGDVAVIGIYRGPDTGVLMYSQQNPEWFQPDGRFRQLYISLGTDPAVNLDVLRTLHVEPQTPDFYLAHPDYHSEGFMAYAPYLVVIEAAEQYLTAFSHVWADITIALAAVSALAVCGFTAWSIRRNGYQLGVLKSMGAPNTDLALMFGLAALLITAAAYLLSIPASIALLGVVNGNLAHTLGYTVAFFAIGWREWAIIAAAILPLTILSTLIPLVHLFARPPADIIRNSKTH